MKERKPGPTEIPPVWQETIDVLPAEHSRTERILNLIDALQHSAWHHANKFNLGFDHLQQQNRMWVLMRFYVRFPYAIPDIKSANIQTWPTEFDRRFAYRDFIIRSDDGDIFSEATSAWAVLEKEDRAIAPMDELLNDSYQQAETPPRKLEFPSKTIAKLQATNGSINVDVSNNDTDINGHVNNVRYLKWAIDSIPESEKGGRDLVATDALFRAESFPGDTLIASWSMRDGTGDRFEHSLVRESDGREVARVLTIWTQKP